jgi:hypothetical protein
MVTRCANASFRYDLLSPILHWLFGVTDLELAVHSSIDIP